MKCKYCNKEVEALCDDVGGVNEKKCKGCPMVTSSLDYGEEEH